MLSNRQTGFAMETWQDFKNMFLVYIYHESAILNDIKTLLD